MKIFDGFNDVGELIYFEVSKVLLSRKRAIKIIKSIPETKDIKENLREDVFCYFKLGGREFQIWEPFGDNSRFYVGEEESKYSYQLVALKEKFEKHKPNFWSLLGR